MEARTHLPRLLAGGLAVLTVVAILAVALQKRATCGHCSAGLSPALVAGFAVAWCAVVAAWEAGRSGTGALIAAALTATHLGAMASAATGPCALCLAAFSLEVCSTVLLLAGHLQSDSGDLLRVSGAVVFGAAVLVGYLMIRHVATEAPGTTERIDRPGTAGSSRREPALLVLESRGCGWCSRLRSQLLGDAAHCLPPGFRVEFVDVSTDRGAELVRRFHADALPHLRLEWDGRVLHSAGKNALVDLCGAAAARNR